MPQEENPQIPDIQKPLYTFSDEVTKRKMKRHLSDINDVITENDIKNVKVPGEEKPVKVPAEKKGKKKKKNIVDDTPGSPVTPWDILQE